MPLDDKRPVVCLDEFCKQLLSESRASLPARPSEDDDQKGTRLRQDAEYVREGSASGFMICAPKLGGRQTYISERATRHAIDYAHAVRFHRDDMFPEAEKILLIQVQPERPHPGCRELPQTCQGRLEEEERIPSAGKVAIHHR